MSMLDGRPDTKPPTERLVSVAGGSIGRSGIVCLDANQCSLCRAAVAAVRLCPPHHPFPPQNLFHTVVIINFPRQRTAAYPSQRTPHPLCSWLGRSSMT